MAPLEQVQLETMDGEKVCIAAAVLWSDQEGPS